MTGQIDAAQEITERRDREIDVHQGIEFRLQRARLGLGRTDDGLHRGQHLDVPRVAAGVGDQPLDVPIEPE